jgi:DNA-directed RNA polymerase subunit RPC12/RpoP
MLFIVGVRVYTDLLATVAYVCDNCGQHAAHHLTRRTRKITLFFLPLFPMSKEYVDTCSYCGRVLGVPRTQVDAAVRQPVR